MKRLTDDERLTPVTLNAIRERAEAATPGPWKNYPIVNSLEFVVIGADMVAETVYEKADAEFIVASREDVPKLLAEIERLQHRLSQSEDLLSEAHDLLDDVHCYETDVYQAISRYLNGGDDE